MTSGTGLWIGFCLALAGYFIGSGISEMVIRVYIKKDGA